MMTLNQKCANCSMASEVTETINGTPLPLDKQYYQCLANMEDECLDGESMNIKDDTQ